MVDEGSASTLVLVAAILKLFVMLGYGAIAAFFFGNLIIFAADPANPILGFGFGMFAVFAALAVISLFLMIVRFIWRSQPSKHRIALIIPSVIGLLTSVIPGILVIVAGDIAPNPEEVPRPLPTRPIAVPKGKDSRLFCGHCGVRILNPAARFCEACGAER
jgi:hypothetical protein